MADILGKISIIVPVYNVENELEKCVNSLINQTYTNVEILLVDDGSPDKCPVMCDEYALEDKRIKVIHKENGGLSDARNVGIKNSSGEYIMYVDSDDYIEIDSCAKLMSVMQEDVDFVAGACKKVFKDRTVVERRSRLVEGKKYSARDFAIESIKSNELYTYACINLYRKSFIIDNNLYYKKGYLFEDTQLLPDILGKANKIAYIDYPFYNYIVRDNSITTSNNYKKKQEMIIKVYSEWFEKVNLYQDKKFRRYMYGALVFQYLWNCRAFHINGWYIEKVDFSFAIKYAVGIKEKIKVILFNFFPEWFSNIPV